MVFNRWPKKEKLILIINLLKETKITNLFYEEMSSKHPWYSIEIYVLCFWFCMTMPCFSSLKNLYISYSNYHNCYFCWRFSYECYCFLIHHSKSLLWEIKLVFGMQHKTITFLLSSLYLGGKYKLRIHLARNYEVFWKNSGHVYEFFSILLCTFTSFFSFHCIFISKYTLSIFII